MDESFLKSCSLFKGVPLDQLRCSLAGVPQHIQCYEKEETVFHFMEKASRIGIIMEGRVRSLKPFPNGSQVDASGDDGLQAVRIAKAAQKSLELGRPVEMEMMADSLRKGRLRCDG